MFYCVFVCQDVYACVQTAYEVTCFFSHHLWRPHPADLLRLLQSGSASGETAPCWMYVEGAAKVSTADRLLTECCFTRSVCLRLVHRSSPVNFLNTAGRRNAAEFLSCSVLFCFFTTGQFNEGSGTFSPQT